MGAHGDRHVLHVVGCDEVAFGGRRPRAGRAQQGDRAAGRHAEPQVGVVAGGGGEPDDVVVDAARHVDPVDGVDHLLELGGVGDRADDVVALVAVVLLEQPHLGVVVGVAEAEPHREAVELDVGQRERALEVLRVLGGDDEERPRHRARHAVGR